MDELVSELGICGKGDGSQFLQEMKCHIWHVICHISEPFQSRDRKYVDITCRPVNGRKLKFRCNTDLAFMKNILNMWARIKNVLPDQEPSFLIWKNRGKCQIKDTSRMFWNMEFVELPPSHSARLLALEK